jgi:dihydrofolate synthase / folylpolyglutamate synthase
MKHPWSNTIQYSKTISYLYSLQWRGMKLGLRNIRVLMKHAGHPERRFRSIHIAGTNGKGSTASFLASIATEAGYKTGLYTSPHLLRFTERIKIDGKELSDARLVYYMKALRPAIDASHATFFEAATAVAFLYFADEGVDLAIIETGLGGRYDATNIVLPLVSVITNVAFDHTEHLGNTLPKIAIEKGGIIKAGVPVITGTVDPQVLNVFDDIARRKKTKVYRAGSVARAVPLRTGRGKQTLRLTAGLMHGMNVIPGLPGAHQAANALLAIGAYDLLLRKRKKEFRRISRAVIARGLARVKKNTGLHGRLEAVYWRGKIILDVAHNPAGIQTMTRALPLGAARPRVAVFGVMRDKEYGTMLRELAGTVPAIVVVAPRTGRALAVRALVREARKAGLAVRPGGSVKEGLRMARRIAGRSGTVLVTGSHYVVAEALEQIQKRT